MKTVAVEKNEMKREELISNLLEKNKSTKSPSCTIGKCYAIGDILG
ncbi:hypothetical protein [Fulvivirga ligni]|nr:hypothetical protein [Fulvivirga ligni]UII20627.1 hypothetical protein LVD16_22555 [Fulvivirga ligni]